jgi:hypothetical protein
MDGPFWFDMELGAADDAGSVSYVFRDGWYSSGGSIVFVGQTSLERVVRSIGAACVGVLDEVEKRGWTDRDCSALRRSMRSLRIVLPPSGA